MFFHFSALQGGSEAFSVGMDVEFSVTREPKGERLNAVEYAVFFSLYAFVLMAAPAWYTYQIISRDLLVSCQNPRVLAAHHQDVDALPVV